MTSKPKVIVTGFGPFRHYTSNPSWEAVKLLQVDEIDLIKEQLEVAYDAVDQKIPELWTKHNPDFMINCGVSYLANDINIEPCASGHGYCKSDVRDCIPKNECSFLQCKNGECVATGIDVEQICNQINQLVREGKLKIGASIPVYKMDGDRYLCEYAYFTSLKHNPNKSLFLHVPELQEETNYTVENIKETIATIIRVLIQNSA